jgi:hypothetical protein
LVARANVTAIASVNITFFIFLIINIYLFVFFLSFANIVAILFI